MTMLAPPRDRGRVVGLDFARFLAILGMMGQHLLSDDVPGAVNAITSGFPSTLFAVLGGVSAIVSTRRYREEGRPVAASVSVATRGVVVAFIGVVLGAAPSFVVVVLTFYGVSLMVVAVLIHLKTWILIGIAAVLAAVGPFLILWTAESAEHYSEGAGGAALKVLRAVLLSGPYPPVTWIVYMLIGVCIGRALTDGSRLARPSAVLAGVGGAMFLAGAVSDLLSRPMVVRSLVSAGGTLDSAERLATASHAGVPVGSGWVAVLNAAPHSGSTADIVRTAGAAILVVALLVFATRRFGGRIPLVLRSVARAGAAPLTIYTAHVLFTCLGALAAPDMRLHSDAPWWLLGPAALAFNLVGMLVIGWILEALRRRGPLETVVSAAARRAARVAGQH